MNDPFKYEPMDGLDRFMPTMTEIEQMVLLGEFILAWETMLPAIKLNDHETLP